MIKLVEFIWDLLLVQLHKTNFSGFFFFDGFAATLGCKEACGWLHEWVYYHYGERWNWGVGFFLPTVPNSGWISTICHQDFK
jgi:hypothetical protein